METIFTVLPDSEAGPEENSNIDISDQGSDDESLVSGTVTPEVVCWGVSILVLSRVDGCWCLLDPEAFCL